jgi:hypothetical protein
MKRRDLIEGNDVYSRCGKGKGKDEGRDKDADFAHDQDGGKGAAGEGGRIAMSFQAWFRLSVCYP